jgi:hypothetical protein
MICLDFLLIFPKIQKSHKKDAPLMGEHDGAGPVDQLVKWKHLTSGYFWFLFILEIFI